jgi:hypothetical protein
MNKNFNSISAIWQSDKKSIEECSKKVYDFLILLKEQNNLLFGAWYKKSTSKKKSLENKIEISIDYFQKDLEKKMDKKFPDLGARISYWTGQENENKASDISFNICAYGSKPFNKNSCVITLPKASDFYNSEENKELLIKLMLSYWKPDKLLINGEKMENTHKINP